MIKYAILCHPGHNRVYFEESKKFIELELRIVGKTLTSNIQDIQSQEIAGVSYLIFFTEDILNENDISSLSHLSFMFALFEIKDKNNDVYFIPIAIDNYFYIDSGISSMLKYTGKTNEIFTRMLINIALCSSDFYNKNDIYLLDPIAGKGTTLFEGISLGYNVSGVEIGDKTVLETFNFIKKYLENEKYKHQIKTENISGENKNFKAKKYNIDIAKTKEDLKQKNIKHFGLIAGNSMYTDKFFRKNYFHIIVGDLPYGVQHGNVTNEKQSSITRNPKELLKICLSAWKEVLKPGGTIVLSWNKFVLPKEDIVFLFESNGFSVFDDEIYGGFEHRVDQSIKRDIIVAKK